MLELQHLILCLVLLSVVWAQSPYRPKTANGEYCMIPFEYQGNIYHDCTTDGGSKPWCRPGANSWDYCSPGPDFSKCNVASPNITIEEIGLIVDLVNNIRAKEPALRMSKIRWNTELAHRAQYMSNQCKLSSDDSNLCSGSAPMGQVSFVTMSNERQSRKWTQFILEFFNKKAAYNIDSNTCSEKYCNGYKQLVNAKTTDIGCAVSSCTKDVLFADYYFCNFYPPIYQGRPYDKGDKPCDSCYKMADYQYRCNKNLCEICDSPSADCQGREELKKDIAAGKVCDDLDAGFCNLNSGICPNIDLLPDVYKEMMTSRCKKTCKLC